MLRIFFRACPFSLAHLHRHGNEGFVRTASLFPSCFVAGRRYLFSAEYLGIENYKRERMEVAERFGSSKDNFMCRMTEYMNSSESNTIFTDDLKSAVCLAENDDDIGLALQMARRFHTRNIELKFSEFVFGPPIMRMLYMMNKPDLAYDLFTDTTLTTLFDQVTSRLILMDLLYENQCYDRVLEVIDSCNEKESDTNVDKYPYTCATIALAACHKLNSAESLEKALSLMKEVSRPTLRAVAFTVLLALTQKKPAVAHELVSSFHVINVQHTPTLYVNVKALTFAALGRAEDAVQTLRVIIEQDLPDHVRRRDEVFEEVLTAVGDVAREFANKEVQRQFAVTDKALRDGGFISQRTLADMLDEPILRARRSQESYKHRTRLPVPGALRRSPANKTVYRRPGLLD